MNESKRLDASTSKGVRREWRVLYRLAANGLAGVGTGPVLSVDVIALTAAAARAQVECDDVRVQAVTEIRPLLDPAKQWLSMEEAALRVGKSVRTIARWVELGLLAKCEGGMPMWTAHAVDLAAARSVSLKFVGEDLKAAA